VGAITVAVICTVWRADRPPAIEGLNVPVYSALTLADLKRQ
jgi:hypothetical protein